MTNQAEIVRPRGTDLLEKYAGGQASLPQENRPTPRQRVFLSFVDVLEILYGGAAGGGKSSVLLMAALQYVDVPGYSALLLRRSYQDLALPGALMDRARLWLDETDARWVEKEHQWIFPSGAKITFGYCQAEKDVYRYQSAEFQFIGFDELTQFTSFQYRYLFSRLRRLAGSTVPIRMRSASNPGGEGHEWVRLHFPIPERQGDRTPMWDQDESRMFIPAKLEDNPHVDQQAYDMALSKLDPITREMLRNGDWSARKPGGMFRREMFRIVDSLPAHESDNPIERATRYWDLAGTESKSQGDDGPSWTVGLLLVKLASGDFYVCDVRRERLDPAGVQRLVKQTALEDGRSVHIWIEQEPGSAGKHLISFYQRFVLQGFIFRGWKETGNKVLRAQPVSAAADGGLVSLVRGPWITAFLDECEAFPEAKVKDQVDALSGAYGRMTQGFGSVAAVENTLYETSGRRGARPAAARRRFPEFFGTGAQSKSGGKLSSKEYLANKDHYDRLGGGA